MRKKNNFITKPPLVRQQYQSGFTLIEVLISSLLLITGVSAFVALQFQTLTNTSSTRQRTQATLLATDIIESARVNQTALTLYTFPKTKVNNLSPTIPICQTCSIEDIALQDKQRWLKKVAQTLPEAEAEIAYNAPFLIVMLSWKAPKEKVKDTSCHATNNDEGTQKSTASVENCLIIKTQICTLNTKGSTPCLPQ